MKTGIVVNNYDPTYKNRIQVRIYGLHTEKVDGSYVILDDDLPWASPAPNGGSNSGAYSVPNVGSRVYVDVLDRYNIIYYGQVEVKGNVKKMMYENADSSDKMKIIAFSEDKDGDDFDYLKIYYMPEDGLKIECDENVILMTKYDGLSITSKTGSKIEMLPNENINISTSGKINLICKEINLITEDADEKVVIGSKLINKFNTHTHHCPNGETAPPITKLEVDDFSKKVRIE